MAPAAAVSTPTHTHVAEQHCAACHGDPIHRLHEEARLAYRKLPLSQRSAALQLFKGLDSNRSGGVTRSELERAADPAVKTVALDCFDALDVDGNGKLSFWETVTLAHVLRVPGKLCVDCSNLLLHGPVCTVCCADNSLLRDEP